MKIFDLESKVIGILKENKSCRCNDQLLYIELLNVINPKAVINFRDAFINREKYDIPPFSSVSRARRKVQAMYPELKDEKISKLREKKEMEYMEYAIDYKNFEV